MTHGADETAIVDRHGTDTGTRSERLADALEDPHCRYLLEYLREGDEPASVAEVATHVVAPDLSARHRPDGEYWSEFRTVGVSWAGSRVGTVPARLLVERAQLRVLCNKTLELSG